MECAEEAGSPGGRKVKARETRKVGMRVEDGREVQDATTQYKNEPGSLPTTDKTIREVLVPQSIPYPLPCSDLAQRMARCGNANGGGRGVY